MTVTGHTVAENLSGVEDYPDGQEVIRDFDNPIKPDSHLVIMYGDLAPDGAVAKITGKEGLKFEGNARVFHSEELALQAILNDEIKSGDVVVVRYEGPKGGPGMREMLSPTSAIMGKGLGSDVAFMTDGRFSGGSHGFVAGHISPEAAVGGPIALIEDGDVITFDAETRRIDISVDEAELGRRRKNWVRPRSGVTGGALAKYRAEVSSASTGSRDDGAALGRIISIALDLSRPEVFTSAMNLNCIHVMCRGTGEPDADKHIKQMARQRCVVATGSSNG